VFGIPELGMNHPLEKPLLTSHSSGAKNKAKIKPKTAEEDHEPKGICTSTESAGHRVQEKGQIPR